MNLPLPKPQPRIQIGDYVTCERGITGHIRYFNGYQTLAYVKAKDDGRFHEIPVDQLTPIEEDADGDDKHIG